MNNNIVWQSPVPSSGFLRGVNLQIRPRREIALTFEFEDDNEEMHSAELSFNDVVHYRTTYLAALRAELIHQAYDRLVELPESHELLEVMEAAKANGKGQDYRHYRVCFDDGPCFDFICQSFAFTQTRLFQP
jgi:uncharacterized protein YndB with AHSA1/START domain